jgi:hypothetical protein
LQKQHALVAIDALRLDPKPDIYLGRQIASVLIRQSECPNQDSTARQIKKGRIRATPLPVKMSRYEIQPRQGLP